MDEKFTFFWRGPFSQWWRRSFEVDGVRYNCAEQFMMAAKARLFGDSESEAKIMKAIDPKVHQTLGRKVNNFDQAKWDANARKIVFLGNYAKFTQHEDLKQILLETGDTTLVEASPYDCVWGIGWAEDHPNAKDRTKWRGTNWLGETLTQVREAIKNGEHAVTS